MNATHTPGPWTAYNSNNGRIFKYWSIASKSGKIATIEERESSADEHGNAMLIAEAPALLKACQHLIEMVEECHNHDIVPTDVEWPILEARAAIAKATGKGGAK